MSKVANLSVCLNQLVIALDTYSVAMSSELATRSTELRIMACRHGMQRLDVIAEHMEATKMESEESMRILREVLLECAGVAEAAYAAQMERAEDADVEAFERDLSVAE